MRSRWLRKKVLGTAAVAALVVAGAGAAFAYFTSTGSGAGTAQTGKAASLTISQVGAGYDSLLASGSYSQDQCFSCLGPSELGNEVTLASGVASQLVSVVVAFDNWGAAITGGPLTVTIPTTVGGAPVSDTVDANFAAAINSQTPSLTNVTFDFSSQGAFVEPSFVYGISYGDENGSPTGTTPDPKGEASLNVALSSSSTDLTVGSDTVPGSIWMNDPNSNNNDFPTCDNTDLPTTGFVAVPVDCGPYNPNNPGAYGNEAGTDDIPAVQVNVVGGVVPTLYPGGPSQPVDLAITNPGPGDQYVNDVTTTIGAVTSSPTNIGGATAACSAAWYSLSNSGVVSIAKNLTPGTTLFVPSGLTISMPADSTDNQDNCEAPYGVLSLGFTSN
jgi:hypothetical protein